MDRLLVALAVVMAALVIAAVVRRRRRPDAPTQPAGRVPVQLDRAEFPRSDAAWLVVVFTSAACQSCQAVASKAAVLESDDVAVVEAEYQRDRAVHARYRIDAVPLVVIADAAGVVRRSFLGPVTATDLWAAVAWAREGTDPPC